MAENTTDIAHYCRHHGGSRGEEAALEIERLREALEPFAAFARAAEAIRIFSGQTVADTKIIQSVTGEDGTMGVLFYGHILDALKAFGGQPKGYGGVYRNLRLAALLKASPRAGEGV